MNKENELQEIVNEVFDYIETCLEDDKEYDYKATETIFKDVFEDEDKKWEEFLKFKNALKGLKSYTVNYVDKEIDMFGSELFKKRSDLL